MPRTLKLPSRQQVKLEDTWDLSSLYSSDDAWEKDFRRLERRLERFATYRGRFKDGDAVVAECLQWDADYGRLAERVGTYAFLKSAEDQANSHYQRMLGRYRHLAVRIAQATSFIQPQLVQLPRRTMARYLAADSCAPFRLVLERILRQKEHTLSQEQEELLAMQGEMASTASRVIRQLVDSDLSFGLVEDERGRQVELNHASFQQLLESPVRDVRRRAFFQYYQEFQGHENTLATALDGSVQKDGFYAKARRFASSLAAALFPDQVPQAVYDHLIRSVRRYLPALHRYYELRRRKMKLRDLHHYDTYVPILAEQKARRTWDQAMNLVVRALEPLGDEYCSVLHQGLVARWCDRYPNRGKHSGAFSCGSYDGDPYILMNYKPDVLADLFTLAHEAGHSMHSYYSARNQPFQYYDYTIFVAEVASTFNERLLCRHLLAAAQTDHQRAYLINREIDDIRATVFRQTMFAEFERQIHQMAEAGEPLTVQSLKDTYLRLLQDYFGSGFVIDPPLALECLRIPHFYRAFYVYKYATGMAAAIALSQRVLAAGEPARNDYLSLLKSGCSKDPLDLLRDAGVDMEKPDTLDAALDYFAQLVAELDSLVK